MDTLQISRMLNAMRAEYCRIMAEVIELVRVKTEQSKRHNRVSVLSKGVAQHG